MVFFIVFIMIIYCNICYTVKHPGPIIVRDLMLFIHSCNKYLLSSYFRTMLGFKRDGAKIYRVFSAHGNLSLMGDTDN